MRLTLEGWSKCDLTLLEVLWHIADGPFNVQLVTVDEHIIAVLPHRLHDRRLESIDPIVQVSHEHKYIWKRRLGQDLRRRGALVDEFAKNLSDIMISFTYAIQA